MSNSNKLPLSAVIFDRTQRGIPDVPVFSNALKSKINSGHARSSESLSEGAAAILARAGLLAVPAEVHSVQPTADSAQIAAEEKVLGSGFQVLGKSEENNQKSESQKVIENSQPVVENSTLPSTQHLAPTTYLSPSFADPVRGQTTGFAKGGEEVETRAQRIEPREEGRESFQSSAFSSHRKPTDDNLQDTKGQQSRVETQPIVLSLSKDAASGPMEASASLVAAETQQSQASIGYSLSTYFSLREDPTLIRWAVASTPIIDQLAKLHEPAPSVAKITSIVFPTISITPLDITLLGPTHRHGFLDRVVIPNLEQSRLFSGEEYFYSLRRLLWEARDRTEQTLSILPAKRAELLQHITDVLASLETVRTQFIRGAHIIQSEWIESFTQRKQSIRRKATQVTQRFHFKKPSLEVTLPNILVPKISVDSNVIGLKKKLSLLLENITHSIRQIHFTQLASRLMIAGSLVMMLLTVGPMVALEAHSWKERIVYSLTSRAEETIRSSDEELLPTPTASPIPAPEQQFQLQIPKIGVDSRVIANVDASNEKEYSEALKKGIAHAAGTGLPGEENTPNKSIFIFGHSTNGAWNITRYNALFYSLKDLSAGDTMKLWFWGKEFDYTVTERKIVAADDISFLQPQTEKDKLILQTCWPPGTTWKRLIVVAEPTK